MSSKVMQSLALCQTVQKTLILSLRRQPLNLCGHAFRKIWTSRDLKPCSYCMLQHQQPIHLSAHVYAKNLRKRALKVIKKPKQDTSPVVLRHHMTPSELARACKTTVEDIYDCLVLSVGSKMYSDPNVVISDMKILKDVVKQLDHKFTISDTVKHGHQETPRKEKDTASGMDVVRQPPPDPSVLVKRPPVVTIMGHVDHGKTTLLDALRHSHVVDQEFGGITQHIGAFSVKLPSGDLITFLDTPGHAAFTAMRARGASVTDIVVLVIAGEDGVMDTTVEALQHARQANVPMIIAINKIDKPGADVEACKRALMSYEVVAEDLGGDVQVVPISALKKINLDILQENIIALSEVMDLKCDPVGLVEGHVIESRTDTGRGKLATGLIHRGTLRKGDYLLAGHTYAKVRAMYNDKGQSIQEATPSTPVEIVGWKELPTAGDEILQVESEKTAKSVLDWRKSKKAEEKMLADSKEIEKKREEHNKLYNEVRTSVYRYGNVKWDQYVPQTADDEEKPHFVIVLKGDVNGSVEAILDTLSTYRSDMCQLEVVSHGVGEVTEHDIQLAETFKGVVYAFNVGINKAAWKLRGKVPIKSHNVIYKMFDDIIEELSSRLPPLQIEEIEGMAEVLDEFHIRIGKAKLHVAGCRCTEGTLQKHLAYKVVRNGETIYKGPIQSLKHHKQEVDSIVFGKECGISLDPNADVKLQIGDELLCISIREEPQSIDWRPGF